MERLNKTLEYLPPSLSSSLMIYEPIPISPPQKFSFKETPFDTTVKNISRQHFLERSFRPYFRASKHVNAIKNLYNKHGTKQFDVSIEDQNKFLHEEDVRRINRSRILKIMEH